MTFESPSSQENPKDIFISALEKELLVMQESGIISPEQAQEKINTASLIEEGFSPDPVHDAILFSKVGIVGEEEIINILK